MSVPVAFLTDYGYDDPFTGSCRLVIERLAPGTDVIDLTHGVPPGDVRRGALALEAAVARAGHAVYLCVVDPQVGTDCRGVAVEAADGSLLVGRDNGLLAPALEALGGAARAADISETPLRLEPVSPTFHGRDVFAPVAAHLASGHPLETAGEEIDAATLAGLELPAAERDGDALLAPVLYADGFGNLILAEAGDNLGQEEGAGRLTITGADGRTHDAVAGRTFAEGEGGLVVYRASSGRLALALDGGSAAAALGVGRDDRLRIAPG